MQIGIFLSSEEHGPADLVAQAQAAERAGFGSVFISDHYHPWLDEQGESPFVWSVIAAIGATTHMQVTTGVTCPIVRMHPAVVAHAVATTCLLLDGRFRFGIGTGENLNEHILGDAWPPVHVRREMLEEAMLVMRKLWTGQLVDHRGRHYTVSNARIYSCPASAPQVLVSAFGPKAAALAARIGEGLVCVSPSKDIVDAYRAAGGTGSVIGATKFCWNRSRDEAVRTAHRLWRTEALSGQMMQELPMPAHFAQAAEVVDEAATAEAIVCGPDVDAYVEHITKYREAGFDELYMNQIGPDQDGFLRFFTTEVQPWLAEPATATA
jgi:G6PDH family F420-dependent oxidoreductase